MIQKAQNFLKNLFDLQPGAEEKDLIIENIKDDSDFSSARFWTLVFAIGVASVGLNINSTPVIIGAMLISPLMGPIVSMGAALAINDWGLLRRSFRNMLMLTTISIIVSALYFAITPITNAQSELLARIQPTIFDVLIAIFGGLAGFIGISRSKQSNVIPGVAIATALMPPLCTVGYGIATMQPKFILGAFYLFLINSIFICLSSLVVATYLKLPKRAYTDEAKKKRVNRIITAITIVMVAPAIYMAYVFVGQNNFNVRSDTYIARVFEDQGYVVIYKNVTYNQKQPTIELAFLSAQFTEAEINTFQDRLPDFGLATTELKIRQDGFSLSREEWESVLSEAQGDEERVQALETRLESERLSFESPTRLLEEAQSINSKIENVAIGSLTFGVVSEDSRPAEKVALVFTGTGSSSILNLEEAETIERWLNKRLATDSLITRFTPEPIAEIATTSTIGR
jgi:uncharacterized hydrophobic protein (TIGR00271 family)